MFDESLIVASAVSAFNNAAVAAPVFFWKALLGVPLFVAIYLLGRNFSDKIGFRPYVTADRISFWTVVLVAMWAVLCGGNYAVLRDGVSLVPWVTAAILLVAAIFVGTTTRAIKLPIWYGSKNAGMRRRWFVNVLVLLIFLVPVALSDTLNWWGPILQVGAVVAGLVLGRFSGRQMRVLPCAIGVMFMATVAILMQPELWRFGQLGNLTPIHLIWVLITGVLIAATSAIVLVNPRERIHKSAYIKLKWMVRFVAALCMILFLLTEAVPIFIASVISVFTLCAMSVWHATSVPAHLASLFMAWTILAFGVLTGLVTLTAMGALWIGVIKSEKCEPGSIKFLL